MLLSFPRDNKAGLAAVVPLELRDQRASTEFQEAMDQPVLTATTVKVDPLASQEQQ